MEGEKCNERKTAFEENRCWLSVEDRVTSEGDLFFTLGRFFEN
jgi:hypothetical protein